MSLACIGYGPLQGDLERELAADPRLADSVQLLGARGTEDVRSSMGNADLLVLPALASPDGDRDGIPVSLMEAMAIGLPVVTTDVSGIPELVTAENGWVAPAGDWQAFARALEAALDAQDEARVRIAVAARRRIEAEFDIARIARRLSVVSRGPD